MSEGAIYDDFGVEGSGDIIVTPGYQFRPFKRVFQYAPSAADIAAEDEAQKNLNEMVEKLRRRTDISSEHLDHLDPRLNPASDELLKAQFSLHGFDALPPFSLRIAANVMGAKNIGLTPFNPEMGYRVDWRDFDDEQRRIKLESCFSDQTSIASPQQHPVLFQAYTYTSNLVQAGVGEILPPNEQSYLQRLKFKEEFETPIAGLRMKVRVGEKEYEAWPGINGKRRGSIVFRDFFPISTGPMAVVEGTRGVDYDRGMHLLLPNDLKRLKEELYVDFYIDEEWVADRNNVMG